jgi:phage shock protein C
MSQHVDRLQRSTTNRQWTGVAGGIGEYFQIDPTLVRVFFVLATIFTGGLFFLVYIALVLIMPIPGRPGPLDPGVPPPSGTGSDPNATTALPPSTSGTYQYSSEAARRRREAAGWLLVALGVVFLLANAGAFHFIDFRYVWPIAIIALGAFILLQRSRS